MRALILIVPAGHLVLVVATATYSRYRTGSEAFKSWIGHDAVMDRSVPIRLEGARVSTGVFNLTDEPTTTDSSVPSAADGPNAAEGTAAGSSPSTGASEEQEWRQSSPQPVKLASTPRELGNSASNPLRCCLHLVVFDMQMSPCPMV